MKQLQCFPPLWVLHDSIPACHQPCVSRAARFYRSDGAHQSMQADLLHNVASPFCRLTHFKQPHSLGPSQKKVDMCRLIFLLCRHTTYLLHLVTLHLLLVVCSTQLASATPLLAAGNNPFLEVLLDNKRLTHKLTSVLLRHYSDFRPLPPKAPLYQPDQDEPAGVFRLVRSAAGTPSPASCLSFLQNMTLDPNRLDSYLLWDESLVFLSGRHNRILLEVCNRARVCLDPHWCELSRPFLVNLPKDRQLQS